MLVSGFVRNEARLTFDILAASRRSGDSLETSMAAWARPLGKLTDAERFPAVTAALRAGELDTPGGPDDEFVFGLERILDGVEALVSARS
ncbi:TetR/AcrR family transcriptional regulator C-terminal domain-containing protein [Streptomyces antimycoticus]|uniref:TetR/AcrR family transcriptional regulator C-terminal domain-containing protein n=1 Tax=Streptomyces antimycoticus TaxID=68175 RepID=A0ABD5JME8_9ACTN|nr:MULTISPECIES: TetR/AcrR family transcriptional regulator C-terminal domain-containing protein [Streptomyces]MEE4588717.1 TetR/AcrR family transcriptional regulator C-terminal domain-containing protein [Streptomyces sp. DSM 41602]WJD98124.1 TetR/AcrR family transcriptional regulator C-terminal domain-containing protein [Streptomyces antimycoticus]WTB06437.1 TetR/AcrR family transcriptional regulator C-terminal domain-containing protein [Streptomyces antimycoticus]